MTFRTLTKVPAEHAEKVSPQQTYAFPATTAKLFRVVLKAAPPRPPLPNLPAFMSTPAPPPKALGITKLAFEAGARVNRFEAKAGFQPSADFTGAPTPAAAPGAAIPTAGVIDLTAKLRPDGRLDWTPPPGRWTVLRFGWSLTGQTNGPAEEAATGLEVDKLDPVAVRGYVEHYLGHYADATGGKLRARGVQNLLTDSWEAGVQNWTARPSSPSSRRRRGYDADALPAGAGRPGGRRAPRPATASSGTSAAPSRRCWPTTTTASSPARCTPAAWATTARPRATRRAPSATA